MTWNVGDRVKNDPANAWLYCGSNWGRKMAKQRSGTVVEVSMYAAETGAGTLLVRWDSLTGGDNSDAGLWTRWVHSYLLERVTS